MMTRHILSIAAALLMIAVGATNTSAQVPGNPFAIDGTVTDLNNSGLVTGLTVPPCDPPAQPAGFSPQACKQIDPNDNTQELGPENASTTKIGVIHNGHIKTQGKEQGTDCTATAPCYVNMLNTTNPNAQVDLNATWIQSAIAPVNGVNHVFLYFAWRRDSEDGSGFISLEIQKSQAGGFRNNCKYDSVQPPFNPALCNPWAGRQGGDIVFLWDQGGSNTQIIAAPVSGPAAWNGTGTELPRILNIPDCSHSGECVALGANAAFATFGTDCGIGFEADMCGEMVVDLTALGVFSTSPTRCESIANIIPGTVTGNSNTADYKDVVLAPFPTISNCGIVNVTKRTVSPDGTQVLIAPINTFGYTLARQGGGVRFSDDIANHPEDGPVGTTIVRPNTFPDPPGTGQPGLSTCKNTNALPTACGDVIEHTDIVAAADFTLVETTPVPLPWQLVDIVCKVGNSTFTGDANKPIVFSVVANSTTSCVITNKLVKTSPTPAARQRVIIADAIRISDVTAGGASNPAPAMSRTTALLKIFSAAGCAAATEVASFQFALSETAPVSGKTILHMSGYSSPNLQRIIVTEGTHQYWWAFQWDGDTFNEGLSIANTCSSPGGSVTVTIVGTQSTIPNLVD